MDKTTEATARQEVNKIFSDIESQFKIVNTPNSGVEETKDETTGAGKYYYPKRFL